MNEIIPNFNDSLFEIPTDIFEDLTEIGIDSILKDSLLKELPIVKALVSIKKLGQNIHDRNALIQILTFIKELNTGIIDKEKLKKYRMEINSNKQKCEKELGRVLILLNGTIETQKSQMLANLFRNYINEYINWEEFCEYSEIIRTMFVQDIKFLKEIYIGKIKDTLNCDISPINRLISLGLIDSSPKGTWLIDPNGGYFREEKFLMVTDIGNKFYQSII